MAKLKKPITVKLPNGEPFELAIDARGFRKMYEGLFRRTLGHLHVSQSYLTAIRECMRGTGRMGSKWKMVQCLPARYRRAMMEAAVAAWWSCRNEYSEVMNKRTLKKPACLLPKKVRISA